MEPTIDAVRRAARRARTATLLAATAVLALALSACGGGFVYVTGDGGGIALTVNAFMDGFDLGHPVHGGEAVTVAIDAGQSIEFDASGPVTWHFSVSGGPFVQAGSSVAVGGLVVTVSPVSPSRVRVSTALSGAAPLPVTVTLTATSNRNNREIATVQLQLR